MIKIELSTEEASAVVSHLPPEAKVPGSGLFYDGEFLHVPDEFGAAAEAADRSTFIEPVPSEVSALQMRRAIRAANLKKKLDAALAQATDEVVEIWEYAAVFARGSETLATFFNDIAEPKLTADDLFRLAGQQMER